MSYVPDDPSSERTRGSAYDRPDLVGGYWRPSYSLDAVAWVATRFPRDAVVVELGAGDGTLSRAVAKHSGSLFATDVSLNMARLLDRRLSGEPNAGVGVVAAEHVPLAERSVDAVVAAQALQFFHSRDTAESVRRIVRPGGTFAAFWHIADRSHRWVDELWATFGNRLNGDHLAETQREMANAFPYEAMAMFRNPQQLSPEEMLSLSHTGDRWGLGTQEQRAASDAAVLDVYRKYPTETTSTLPYHTAVWVFSDQPMPHPSSPNLLTHGEVDRALRAYTHFADPASRSRFHGADAVRGRADVDPQARRTPRRGERRGTHRSVDRPTRADLQNGGRSPGHDS